MSIVAIDLLTTNGGALPPSIFPRLTPEEIERKLDAYLTRGYALAAAEGIDEADSDEIARAWAYHAAFDEVYLSIGPATVSLQGEESWTWTSAQLEDFRARAAAWLATYEELIAVAVGEDEPDQGWATVTSLRH